MKQYSNPLTLDLEKIDIVKHKMTQSQKFPDFPAQLQSVLPHPEGVFGYYLKPIKSGIWLIKAG